MENENKVIAGKQIITLVLKADAWEETENNIFKQKVEDLFVTDENAQVYFGSEEVDKLFDDEDSKTIIRAMFDRLTRIVTYNGYIEAYIDTTDIPISLADIPIMIMQDRNESKIEQNHKKAEKENEDKENKEEA